MQNNKITIEYDGEFGAELQTVIPYAYYLHKNGMLEKTVSAQDTKCLYYFSENHTEVNCERRYISPKERKAKGIPNKTEHRRMLDTSKWMAPPYKEKYKNKRFFWEKEPLIIMNKYNTEWDGEPVNFIPLSVLEEIISLLKDRYQIIYCRPRNTDIVMDNSEIKDYGDYDLVSKYEGVLTIQDIYSQNTDLTFNEFQLMLFSNCDKYISVQGGNSVLASYFATHNIIYLKKGRELVTGDLNYFYLFNKAKVYPCACKLDFLDVIKHEFFLPQKSNWTKNLKWLMRKYNKKCFISKLISPLKRIRKLLFVINSFQKTVSQRFKK